MRHPVTGEEFELQDDGTIKVTDAVKGISGIFDLSGKHISGDLLFADPQMINWVGGPALQKKVDS